MLKAFRAIPRVIAKLLTTGIKRNADRFDRRSLQHEPLEPRQLLAIVWGNPDPSLNGFDAQYGDKSDRATALVQRAIADWNNVLTSFNYAEDLDTDATNDINDTLTLTILAENFENNPGIPNGVRGLALTGPSMMLNSEGKPYAAEIRLDNNAGKQAQFADQWYIDEDLSDSEFTSVIDTFKASFVAQGDRSNLNAVGLPEQSGIFDFYTTVVHEIGHTVGITSKIGSGLDSQSFPLFEEYTTPGGGVGYRALEDPNNDTRLSHVVPDNPVFGTPITLTGGVPGNGFRGAHVYEGSSSDPSEAFIFVSGTGYVEVGIHTHPNDLMTEGRTEAVGFSTPSSNFISETGRRLITDLNLQLLADVYGYSVVMPSTQDSMHATLDPVTGVLLVQRASTVSSDVISLTKAGDDIVVTVNGHTESISSDAVQQIIIHGDASVDTISVDSAISQPHRLVDYVVSSNRDERDDTTVSGDGVADNDATVPGAQTTIRSAVVDAAATGQAKSIFVPRGAYELELQDFQDDEFNDPGFNSMFQNLAIDGDIDIDTQVSIFGGGAEHTEFFAVEDTGDRLFHVLAGGDLTVDGLTLSGGNPEAFALANNDLLDGGAIRVESGGLATLEDVAVRGSVAEGTGGAIYTEGTVSLERVELDGNEAVDGGGIAVGGGVLGVSNSLIVDNIANPPAGGGTGGGVHVSNGVVSVSNSTVSGNEAEVDGGAFQVTGGSLILQSGTVTDNRAGVASSAAGGVNATGGAVTLTNTIVAGNASTTVGVVVDDLVGQFAVTSAYNLIGRDSTTGNGIDDSTSGNLVGGELGAAALDAGLDPLSTNGGVTRTHGLSNDSLAVNSGDPLSVAGQGGVPAGDQRGDGFSRVVGSRIDIGAFERQPGPTVVGLVVSGSQSTDPAYSYASVVGSGDQLKTVPIAGLDTIKIAFSEDVVVSESDLRVVGSRTATVPVLSTGGFSYDSATAVATWVFEGLSVPDQYIIQLSDGVTDGEGNVLDGEWVNPSSINAVDSLISEFPSGDGVAGGTFAFLMTVLPGDTNTDGIVDVTDLGTVGGNFGSSGVGFAGGDMDGDGDVDLLDWDAFGSNYNTDLTDAAFLLADVDGDFDVDGAENLTGVDLNSDGVADGDDLALAFAQLGLEFETELTV